MAKKSAPTIEDILVGRTQPISSENEPEQFIPYVPGDDFTFDFDKHNKTYATDITDPFDKSFYKNYGGKYYVGSAITSHPETVQGEEQPWTSKLINGVVGHTASIATKLGTAVAEIGGGAWDLVSNLDPSTAQKRLEETGTRFPHLYENFLTKAFETVENDWIEEKWLPVYGGQKYQADNLWKQMGDMKFWSSDLADAVAFSIASYAPITAFTKAATAMKMLGKGVKVLKDGTMISEITGKAVKGTEALSNAGRIFTAAGATTWNTIQEAAFEGRDGLKQIRNTYAMKYYERPYDNLTDEQKQDVNVKSAPLAANIFNANIATLGASNLIQTRFFMGPITKNTEKLIRSAKLGKITADEISRTRSAVKGLLTGVGSEALYEEGLQNAYQQYETKRAKGTTTDNRANGYAWEWINNFNTTEGQKSLMLGALIGGPMGAGAGLRDAISEKKIVGDYANEYERVVKERFPLYTNTLVDNIKHFYKEFDIETTDDKGVKTIKKSLINADGNYEIDLNKVSKLNASNMFWREMLDRSAVAAINLDKAHEKIILNDALQHMFYQFITNPLFDNSDDAYETMLEKSNLKQLAEDEELKKAGLDYDDMVRQLGRMKTEWDRVDKDIYSTEDLTSNQKVRDFKNIVEKGLFYERNKLNVLTDLESIVKDKKQLDGLREEADKFINLFQNKEERNKLFDEYSKDIDQNIDLRNQLNEELKKDPNSLQVKKLQYLINENSLINGEEIAYQDTKKDPIRRIPRKYSLVASPASKTNISGLKNAHYFNIGADAIAGVRLESAIESAKTNDGLSNEKANLSKVVDLLTADYDQSVSSRGKYDITKEDIDEVRKLIPIEKQFIDDAFKRKDILTQEDYSNRIDELSTDTETDPNEIQRLTKEAEEKLELGKNILNDYNNAIDRLNTIETSEDGKGLLNYRNGISKLEKDDNVFTRNVADTPVRETSDILSRYNANKEVFSDLPSIERTITSLETHKALYTDTELSKRLDNKAFKNYIESIDKAIKKLKEIHPEVEKKYKEAQDADKRYQVNKNKKKFAGIGIIVKDDGTYDVVEQDIVDAISGIIGADELKKILDNAKEASENGVEYAYRDIFVDKILTLAKSKLKKEELDSFIGQLTTVLNKRLELFEKTFISEVSQNKTALKSSQELVNKYKVNPIGLFRDLIMSVTGYKNTDRKTAIDKYIDNHDVLEFRDNMLSETDTGYVGFSKENYLNLINQHIMIEGLQESIEFLSSSYDVNKQIKEEEKAFEEKKKAPTNQQTSVLRTVLRWFHSPIKDIKSKNQQDHHFKNVIFVKGRAATGKTQIMEDYVQRTTKTEPGQIIAIAPHKDAADMMDKSIVSSNKALLADNIEETSIPENISLIFIDEVAALTNQKLLKLFDTLYKINEKRVSKFKIIAFGDPSQLSAQETYMTTSVDPIINNPSGDAAAGMVYMETTDPLTQRFRSPLDVINNFLDLFDGNSNEVSNINVYSNVDAGYSGIGIHARYQQSDLRSDITLNLNNGKTKAVVVRSEKEAAFYRASFPIDKYPQVEIFTANNVAGIERDEVYVDLSIDQFKDAKDFNRAFYTAAGRGKQYISFYDKKQTIKNNVKQELQRDYSEFIKEQNKKFDEINKAFAERVAFEKQVMEGVKPVIRRDDKAKEEEDVRDMTNPDENGLERKVSDNYSDAENPDDKGSAEEDSNLNTDPIGSAISNPNIHVLELPTYKGALFNKKFKTVKDKSAPTQRLLEGGEVIYVKVRNKIRKGDFTIRILGQLYDQNSQPIKGRYADLGYVSDKEIESDTALGKKLVKAAIADERFNTINVDETSNIATLQYDKGSEVYNATSLLIARLEFAIPLTYVYDQNKVVSGKGLFNYLRDIYNKRIHNRQNIKSEDNTVIYGSHNRPSNKYAGVPYYIWNSKGYPQQSVRLNPRNLSKDNVNIVVLREFNEAVKRLESFVGSKLSDKKFNTMIHKFAANYHIVGKNIEYNENAFIYDEYKRWISQGIVPEISEEQFNNIREYIDPVITNIYGPGKVKQKVKSEEEMKALYKLDENNEDENSRYEYVPHIRKNKSGEKVEDGGYVYKYNKAESTDKGKFEYIDGLRIGQGKAQEKLDIIAKANEKIGNEPIRVTHLKTRSVTGEKLSRPLYITSAKSILATEENMYGYYTAIREILKANNKTISYTVTLKDGTVKNKEDRFVDETNIVFVEEYLISEGLLTEAEISDLREQNIVKPITSDLLDRIANFEGERHPSLRTPLHILNFNEIGEDIEENIEELENSLETNLIDIIPTSIGIRHDFDTKEKNKEKKEKKSKLEEAKDIVKKEFRTIKNRPKKDNTKGDDGIADKHFGNKPKAMQDRGEIPGAVQLSQVKIKKMIKKMIPDISDSDIEFIYKSEVSRLAGNKESWGVFLNGIIHLTKDPQTGTVYDKIARHEVFHKIYTEYLTPEEQKEVNEMAMDEFDDYNSYGTIEELLAVKFHEREWGTLEKISNFFKSLFDRIKKLLGYYTNNINDIDDLFRKIEYGLIDNKHRRGDNTVKRMKDIRTKYTNVSNYLSSINYVQSKLKKYRIEGIGEYAIPSTRDEIIAQINIDLGNEIDAESKKTDVNEYKLNMLKLTNENLKELVSDIFPGFNNYEGGVYKADLNDDIIEELTDETKTENLNKHIIPNEKYDTEKDITKEVKEFLSYVEANGTFLSWRYVYVKMLAMFEGLNFDADNIFDQIKESFGERRLNVNEKAIFEHLKDLFTTVESEDIEGFTLTDKIKFLDNDVVVYSNESISDLKHLSDPRIEAGSATVLVRQRGESSLDFVERISKATEPINVYLEEIIEHKRKAYARQTWSNLVTHFNSHRQRNPKIGERISSYGGYEVRYFYARGNAVITGLKSGLIQAITNTFDTKEEVTKFVKVQLSNWKTQYKDNDIDFVKAFLRHLDLSDYANSLTDYKVSEIKDDIIRFFEAAQVDVGNPKEGSEDKKETSAISSNNHNDTEDVITIRDIIDAEGNSMLNRMSEAVGLLDDLNRILSSNDANGERRYNAVLTSQMHKNIYQLIASHFNKIKGARNKLSARTLFDNDFFKNNIFIKQLNTIYRLVDDDGMQYETWNGSEGSMMYDREKRSDFNFRTFQLGFLSSIKASSKRSPRYTQFIYPNERTTASGIEIDVLKKDKLIKAIKYSIDQIAGKEDKLYLKEYNKNKHIGFEIYDEVIGDRKLVNKYKLAKGEVNSTQLAQEIYDALDIKSRELTKRIIDDKMPLDSALPKMTKIDALIDHEKYGQYRSISSLPTNNGGYLQLLEKNDDFKARTGVDASKARELGLEKNYMIKDNIVDEKGNLTFVSPIQPYVSLFYINNYVNAYHFTQLIVGDTSAFKNSDDLVKRLSIATAPGKTGYVHPKHGMNPTSRILVIDDPVNSIDDVKSFLQTLFTDEKQIARILKLYEESGYMPSDGQGFARAQRIDDINYGFGEDFGNVLKPVYNSIGSDNINRSLKYSIVNLKEIANYHPNLMAINNKMNKYNIDEVVFASAMKNGQPAVRMSWNDLINPDVAVNEEATFELDNRDYRIQLDPGADLDSQVSHPTQLSYLLKLYGTNNVLTEDTYNSLQKIVKYNFDNLKSWINKDNITFSTVIKRFANKKGQDDIMNLLNEGIDFNFPSVADRLLTHFISSMFKNTAKIVYPGSKLVLQTSKGIQKRYEDKGEDIPEELKRELRFKRDKNDKFYAECILPKGFLPQDQEEDILRYLAKGIEPEDVYMFDAKSSKDALGFRIPSSELHSAVPIKIVGFYDSKGTNVIVAPRELVPIHGSDFDIDSLFVMKRARVEGYNDGNPVGYFKSEKNGKITYTFDTDPSFINDVPKRNQLQLKVHQAYYTNKIIENFLSVTTDPKNTERMTSPISFAFLEKEAARMKGLTKEDYGNKNLSDINHAQEIHSSLYTGEIAIGMFMNMLKGFAFLHNSQTSQKSGKKTHPISVLKKTRLRNDVEIPMNIVFNGEKYNDLRDESDNGETSGYRFDSLANAALDNLKKMILPYLNLGTETIRAYSVMVMHGVNTSTINNFISQPILKYYTKYGYYKANSLVKRIGEVLDADEKSSDSKYTDEEMLRYLNKSDKYNVDTIQKLIDKKDSLSKEEREFLTFQYKVSEQFDTLDYLGKSISGLAKMTNVIRKVPNKIAEIEEILSFARGLSGNSGVKRRKNESSEDYVNRTIGLTEDDKSTFPYYVDNFWNTNQHIYQVLHVMQYIVDKVGKEFVTYSPEFRKIASKIYSDIGIKLEQTQDVTEKKIRDEFVKFLMTSIIDRSQLRPLKWTNKNKKNVMLQGLPAFNERFCNMIEALKAYDRKKKEDSKNDTVKYEGNPFIHSLNVIPDKKSKLKKIIFNGPSRMDISDLNLFRESFEQLSTLSVIENKKGEYEFSESVSNTEFTDFQRMFVTYAMINYGMYFGLRNYSTILPGTLYKAENDRLMLLFNDIKNLKEKELNNVIEAFEVQLVSNYPDSLWYKKNDMDPVSNGKRKVTEKGKEKEYNVYEGSEVIDGERYYYDRKFISTDPEHKWPKYHVEKNGDKVNIYRIQNVEYRKSAYRGDTAYYVKVGMKNRNPIYDLTDLDTAKQYSANTAFDMRTRHYNGFINPDGILESDYHKYEVGETFKVSSFNDPGKMYEQGYKVKKVIGSNSYLLEKHDSDDSKGYERDNDAIVQKYYDEINARLRKRGGNFRAGKGTKIFFSRTMELANKGRREIQAINNDIFNGYKVIKERQSAAGWQVIVDIEEIRAWRKGKQLDLFNKGYTVESANKVVTDYLFNEVLNNNIALRDFIDLLVETDSTIEEDVNSLHALYDGKDLKTILNDIEHDEDTSVFESTLIKWMRPYLEKLEPVFKGDERLRTGRLGEFKSTGVFSLDYIQLVNAKYSPKMIDRIILHELIHGLTIVQLKNDPAFRAFIDEQMRLLRIANPQLAEEYNMAFKDADEFISELFSNERFFNDLNKVPAPKGKTGFLKRIWNKIISLFKKSEDPRAADTLMKWVKDNLKPMNYTTTELMGQVSVNYSVGYDAEDFNKILDQASQYSIAKDANGRELDHYITADGSVLKRTSDRITGFVSHFIDRKDKRTPGEKAADKEWKFTDKTISKNVNKKDQTYDEYKESIDKNVIDSAVAGTLKHRILMRVVDRIQNNGANEEAINTEIMRIANQDVEIEDSTGKKYTIKVALNPQKYEWFENKIKLIFDNHNINTLQDIPNDLKDILATEVSTGIKEIGYASTADLVIRHSDGTYSIKDLASGSKFDQYVATRMLAYGDQNRQLMDTPRDLKKLQLMMNAIMLKANNKGMRFRDLSVMWIPNEYHTTVYDGLRRVEADDYLAMIESFFKDKKALKEAGMPENSYDILVGMDPEIFNPSEYTDEYVESREGLKGSEKDINDTIISKLQSTDEEPSVVANRILLELQKITGTLKVDIKKGKTKYENLTYTQQVRAKLLTNQLLQILQDPNVSININPDLDVSAITAWIGNYSAMPLPQIQIWKKFRDEQERKALYNHYMLFNEFTAYNRAVLNEFWDKHPVLSKKWLNNADYSKIYGFAYMEYDDNGSIVERLITENDTEQWSKLTDKQKNLLRFMNTTYKSYFDGKNAYLNQKTLTITEFGETKDISVLDMFNRGLEESHRFKWREGWFPKVQKEQSEQIIESGDGSYVKGLFSKQFWQKEMLDSATYYLENNFEGRTHNLMVLPLKYIGNFGINNRRDYSHNLEFQFDRFIKSIEYKKNMDPVYSFGESLRGMLSQVEKDDQPLYHNTAQMFEKKLTSDVLGRTIRQSLTRKPLRVKFIGAGAEDREIRTDALLTLGKHWVSATTMWLKPFTGAGNGLHATLLHHRDGLKGTIGSMKFANIEGDAIDYTLKDSLFADGVYFGEHVKNAMLGKIEQDKTWLLLKKLEYLPDNFDFRSSDKYLLSLRNKMLSESSMYTFHRMPEEFVSMITMIAQLKHLKHPTKINPKTGKLMSLWECYEVKPLENGEYDVVWTGGKRGVLKTGKGEMTSYTDIEGLTAQEIAKLKRVYERMQGGYRKEEAAALEVYVLGKVFIQLKKYIPQLLLNAWKSRQTETDLGMLKATSERKDGETVYEWIGRVNEGKYRVLGKFLLSTMLFRSGHRDYKWSNLTPEMKQHVIDATVTLGMYTMLYAAYLKMFDDDNDEDTMKKWWKMYLLDNFIQQYDIQQQIKLTGQMLQPVALTRAMKAVGGVATALGATYGLAIGDEEKAFTQKGDFRGWLEIKKSIPLMASYTDLARRLENMDDSYFQMDMFSKWR